MFTGKRHDSSTRKSAIELRGTEEITSTTIYKLNISSRVITC